MASQKSIALAAAASALKARKEAQGEENQRAAVEEAARVRQMFADDRSRLERRYGVISARSMNSESRED
jgi:hypothetical protein